MPCARQHLLGFGNHVLERELPIEPTERSRRQIFAAHFIDEEFGEGLLQRSRIPHGHENTCAAVEDRFRCPPGRGCDYRYANRHRFQHDVRQAFVTGIEYE